MGKATKPVCPSKLPPVKIGKKRRSSRIAAANVPAEPERTRLRPRTEKIVLNAQKPIKKPKSAAAVSSAHPEAKRTALPPTTVEKVPAKSQMTLRSKHGETSKSAVAVSSAHPEPKRTALPPTTVEKLPQKCQMTLRSNPGETSKSAAAVSSAHPEPKRTALPPTTVERIPQKSQMTLRSKPGETAKSAAAEISVDHELVRTAFRPTTADKLKYKNQMTEESFAVPMEAEIPTYLWYVCMQPKVEEMDSHMLPTKEFVPVMPSVDMNGELIGQISNLPPLSFDDPKDEPLDDVIDDYQMDDRIGEEGENMIAEEGDNLDYRHNSDLAEENEVLKTQMDEMGEEHQKRVYEISLELDDTRRREENVAAENTELAHKNAELHNDMAEAERAHQEQIDQLRSTVADYEERFLQQMRLHQQLLLPTTRLELQQPQMPVEPSVVNAVNAPISGTDNGRPISTPNNIFELSPVDSNESISYESASEKLLSVAANSCSRFASPKTVLIQRFKMLSREDKSVTLHCTMCVKTLNGSCFIDHFLSNGHAKKMVKGHAALSRAAFEYWVDKLQSVPDAQPKQQQSAAAAAGAMQPVQHAATPGEGEGLMMES